VNQKAEALKSAIAGLEAQRSVLGDAVVEPAIAALRQQMSEIDTSSDRAVADERKIVTVIFADISGFTAMSEKMDPEEVRGVMNACFQCLVPIVQKYEGTIDKFIGDEIMALFGAPVAHEDDPERALRTALEMMEAIEAFNRRQGTRLGIHIGVNTGPVIAGKIGVEGRRDYSVMGDAVNLAARLEDASSAGEIFVGPSTYRQSLTLFDYEQLAPLPLKGKEQPVQIHRLMGVKSAPKTPRGIEGLRSALIGRESELERMRSALNNLRNGCGSIVAVVGEAGLGKSRLVAEALQSFGNGMSMAEGRALSYTAGMSYWMARDVLRALIQVKADASPAVIESALHESVAQTLPEAISDVYPYLAELMGVSLQDAMAERVKFLTGEALQGRILKAFQDYIRARAGHEPLVLFWEDLHWCDPSSLRVLEKLLPLTKDAPLLLLLAYRLDQDTLGEFQLDARRRHGENFQLVELSPLKRNEAGTLISNLLQVDNLPANVHELIVDRAEGNPFFLEELLRSLLDAGVVVLEKDRLTATRAIEAVEVPETVHGVLTARIDRLPLGTKQTLQSAAVVGRIFPEKVLARLHKQEPPGGEDLRDSLSELVRRQFIQSRGPEAAPDQREYSFKHAITHEVAYNSLLIARRRELHNLAGEAIESLFPDRLDELAATLGYHFEKAEVRDKAIDYLRRAGQRAAATFANTEAIGFYRSVLQQLDLLVSAGADDAAERAAAEIQENIGDIQQRLAQMEEARAAYEEARRRIPSDDAVWLSRLYRKTAKAWIVDRLHDDAERAYQEAEKVLQSRATPSKEWQEEWLQIQLDRVWLHYWRGETREIMALAEKIRPLIDKHATTLQRGSFFQGLTLMALRRDRYTADKKTIADAEASLAAIEESKLLPEIGHARFVLGFSNLWAGQLGPADKWINDALKLAVRIGDIVLQTRCLTYLTVIRRRRGELEATLSFSEQSLASASSSRMPEYMGMAMGNLAWVRFRQNDLAQAHEQASAGVAKLLETPQGHILLWVALWPLIGVALARQETDEAIQHVSELLVPPQMAMPAALEAELRSAVETWKKKDHNAAHRFLKKATDMARAIGYL
jgi:class 3 adenylate cyclase/tetratricopeptide (TPR) repeat protein